MSFHQKNLLWDEGILSGPLFCRLSFFSDLAEWNKRSPSPVALQARNPLVSSSRIINVLRNKCLANLILVNHFWIFDWLLLFYPTGNLIVFVGERFTIALFFLAETSVKMLLEILESVHGSHCNCKKSIFAIELELKLKQPSNMIKQTIDS